MLSALPESEPQATAAGKTTQPLKGGGRRKRPTVPPNQRRRIKVACEECRRTKAKCNGQIPKCGRCARTDRSCRYPDTVHNRLPAITTSHGKRNDVMMSCNSREENEPESEHFVLGGGPMPVASVTVVNQGATRVQDFEGISSYWSFFSSVKQAITNDLVTSGNHNDADYRSSVHQPSIIDFGTDRRTAVLTALPPREVVDFLSGIFFRFAQANYFYIHPDVFYLKLSAFYERTNEFNVQSSLDCGRSNEFICLLFMVLAIGSQFANVSSASNAEDKGSPSVIDFARIRIPECMENPGWQLYEVSRQLLPDIITSSSMTSVQACVLQGIFLPSTTSRDAGYSLLGLALRKAINMGMHQSLTTTSLHHYVREMRNRLWWSVYVAERLFSIEMGRPLAISDAEIDTPFPTNMPEWNNSTRVGIGNIDALVAMARVCRLLGQIVETMYCKPSSEKGTTIRPAIVRRLKSDLEQSKRDLPEHLKFVSNSGRSVAHLALTYEQASILLTRPCLNYTAIERSTSELTEEARIFINQQAKDCIKAALASIQILSSLHSKSLLNRFSFHDSLYCSAALYVILLAENQAQHLATIPKESIHQGIQILLYLAEGNESAAAALKYALRAFQSCSGNRNRDLTSENQDKDEMTLRRGRKAWESWMAEKQTSRLSHFDLAQSDSSGHEYMHEENPQDIPGQLKKRAEHIRQRRTERRYELGLFTYSLENSPQSISDNRSNGEPETQPIWIPDNPNFNIMSRDLTGFPNLGSYNERDLL